MRENHIRLLLVSEQIIKQETILSIGQAICQSNLRPESYKIVVNSLQQESESALKLKLLSPGLLATSLPIQKHWAICSSQELINIDVKNIQGVFVINPQPSGVEHTELLGIKKFCVRTLQEALNILNLKDSKLEERYKMEKYLKSSQVKYGRALTISKFVNLTDQLVSVTLKLDLNQTAKWMKVGANHRVNRMRRYFTTWLIFHYSRQIQSSDLELTRGQYLLKSTNKKLMMKCFKGWKQVHIDLVCNKI